MEKRKTLRIKENIKNLRNEIFCILALFVLVALSFALHVSEGAWGAYGKGELRVWFFDVGQGDSIFFETPLGEQWLIDAGPDNKVLSKLGSVMPPYDRTIDAMVITHPHADHVSGFIDVLARYEVGKIYLTGVQSDSLLYKELSNSIQNEGSEIIYLTKPAVLLESENFSITSFYPTYDLRKTTVKDLNESSIVLEINFGSTDVLLTGDILAGEEYAIASAVKKEIDVLKVAHHGSAYSTSDVFLNLLQPKVGVISVGKNSYGHPAPPTTLRLKEHGVSIMRTDDFGDIFLISSGGEPSISAHPLPF